MEYPRNKKIEGIGTAIIVITLIPAILFAVQAILLIAWFALLAVAFNFNGRGGDEIKLPETGESYIITTLPVFAGDGYQNYEIRRKGDDTVYGLAESGEGSRYGASDASGILCVWPATSAGPKESGCLFYFDPKTRQAYLTRPE